MKYSLNAGVWNNVFAVPSSVVDKYIKLAGGNSLKVLLYLLRHGGEQFSEEQLAGELGFREIGEVEDAVQFWVQRGIIRSDDGESVAAEPALSDAGTQLTQNTTDIKVKPVSRSKAKIHPANVSPSAIADRITNDGEFKFLFDEAERLYGRMLRPRESQMITALVDHYGLPVGVAVMLLNYCFKSEKTAPGYILAVADDWASEEISTIDLADAKIRSLERQNGVEERLREAMEMKTKLSAKMRKYIRTWTEEWHFDEQMIMLAYEKTIDQIKEWKPEYANKILESWNNAGIHTTHAVEQSDMSRKKAGKTAVTNQSSSFDMDDVMSQIKNRYKG